MSWLNFGSSKTYSFLNNISDLLGMSWSIYAMRRELGNLIFSGSIEEMFGTGHIALVN